MTRLFPVAPYEPKTDDERVLLAEIKRAKKDEESAEEEAAHYLGCYIRTVGVVRQMIHLLEGSGQAGLARRFGEMLIEARLGDD